MRSSILLIVMVALASYACVPQSEYAELQKRNNQLEKQLMSQDSLTEKGALLTGEDQEMEDYLQEAWRENEQLRATNIGLNQSYQELLMRYSALVDQNQDVLNVSSDRNYKLQQELTAQDLSIQEKQQQLQQLEQAIQQRERELQYVEGNYQRDMISKDQKIIELQNELFKQQQQMQRMESSINTSIANFSDREITVTQNNGQVNISLSQELLFRSGSSTIDGKGRDALRQVANAIKQNPEVEVLVVGHTDSDGSADTNWELSVNRALTVVKELTFQGVDPKRITVAGKGEYQPIASNASNNGKAQNRRTEIILSPQMQGIYNAMDTN